MPRRRRKSVATVKPDETEIATVTEEPGVTEMLEEMERDITQAVKEMEPEVKARKRRKSPKTVFTEPRTIGLKDLVDCESEHGVDHVKRFRCIASRITEPIIPEVQYTHALAKCALFLAIKSRQLLNDIKNELPSLAGKAGGYIVTGIQTVTKLSAAKMHELQDEDINNTNETRQYLIRSFYELVTNESNDYSVYSLYKKMRKRRDIDENEKQKIMVILFNYADKLNDICENTTFLNPMSNQLKCASKYDMETLTPGCFANEQLSYEADFIPGKMIRDTLSGYKAHREGVRLQNETNKTYEELPADRTWYQKLQGGKVI